MKILYAEDDKTLRNTFLAILKRFGHDVTAVRDGQALLDELFTSSNTYDLVLTDNNMSPGLSGLLALRQIRASGRFADVPVIVCSADDIKADVEGLGATYLKKGDLSMAELGAAIEATRAR